MQESIYTVLVREERPSGFLWTVLSIFNQRTWGILWSDLGVTEERWNDWQRARGSLPVIAKWPELSVLAHIDEGSIDLDALRLKHDCEEAISLTKAQDSRRLLQDMLHAAATALESRGTIVVHPFFDDDAVGDKYFSGLDGRRRPL